MVAWNALRLRLGRQAAWAAAAWGAVLLHDNKSATRELLMFQFGLCAACYEAEWQRRRQLRSDPHQETTTHVLRRGFG